MLGPSSLGGAPCAEVEAVGIDAAEVEPAGVDAAEVEPAGVDATEVEPAGVDAVEVEVAELISKCPSGGTVDEGSPRETPGSCGIQEAREQVAIPLPVVVALGDSLWPVKLWKEGLMFPWSSSVGSSSDVESSVTGGTRTLSICSDASFFALRRCRLFRFLSLFE